MKQSLRPTQEQKGEFDRLAQEWRNAVKYSSDTLERMTHPAYKKIIEMGPNIVPLLLQRVADRHEHWFWALESITGEDPVDPEDSGDVLEISRAWAEWGRRQDGSGTKEKK